MQRSLAAFAIVALVLAVVPDAHALMAAREYCAEPVAPLGSTIPRSGALIVTRAPCGESSSRARAITSTFAGTTETLEDEEIAPGLHRRAPASGFAPGVHTIEGLWHAPTGLTVTDAIEAAPAPPAVRSLARSERRVRVPLDEIGPRTAWARPDRITMTLRLPVPSGVVAILVRWSDWHDAQGGVYGAWTAVAPRERRFVLICEAEDGCHRSHGQLPRHQEAFVARYVDVNGQVSEPSAQWVVTGTP